MSTLVEINNLDDRNNGLAAVPIISSSLAPEKVEANKIEALVQLDASIYITPFLLYHILK